MIVLSLGTKLVALMAHLHAVPGFTYAACGFLGMGLLSWFFRGQLMLFTVLVHELCHVFSALAFHAYQTDLHLSGLVLSWLVGLAGNLVHAGFVLASGLLG